MKSQSRLRWVVAGILWAVAILLLQLAHHRIDEIGQQRASNERWRADARFRRLEAERLARVSQLRDGLVMHVSSVALGLISLRGDLEGLASAAGVHLDLDCEVGQTADDQIACHISVRGPAKGLLKVLAEIDQRPYLQPRAMELKVATGAAEGLLEERFSFHYQIRAAVAAEEVAGGSTPTAMGARVP